MGVKQLKKKIKDGDVNRDDKKIMSLMEARETKIKVVGCGGAGNNTITRLMEVGIEGAETIAVNTDAQDLLYTDADKKILIGKELTGGLGAGSDPTLGMEAARESKSDLKEALRGADLVFLTCGLGGGTGTGSIPFVADLSKKQGALTVAVVTMPFSMEGKHRRDNAEQGLEKLEKAADTLIIIPNDRLLEIVPDVSISTAFKIADEILVNAVKGTAELITKPGLVNLDFADVRAVMGNGGIAMIGLGESDSENRAFEAVERALNNPLLSVDIEGAKGALINVTGGEDITMREAQQIVEAVSSRLSDDAKIIWGSQISEDFGNKIRALLVITGVKSPQIFGHREPDEKSKKDIEQVLGVDFLE